jgi:hypothetical protein
MTTDQYVDAFMKGILNGLILAWPIWALIVLVATATMLVRLGRRLLAPRHPVPRLYRGSRTTERDIRVPPQTRWRCAKCGAFLSSGVRDYCLARPKRFNGQVFCFRHQRTRRRFDTPN